MPGRRRRFKYRLFYGTPDEERVRYDNERGKGDHRHIGGREEAFAFSSIVHSDISRLEVLGLVERTDEGAVSVPYESVEIRVPLAQVA